jgi:hypothetical protein
VAPHLDTTSAELGHIGTGLDSASAMVGEASRALQRSIAAAERGGFVAVEAMKLSLSRGVTGARTLGKWKGPEGSIHDLSSGDNDEWYEKARPAAALFPHRAVSRLATHLEVREVGPLKATIIIDRQVCGRRPIDSNQPFTCDRFLAQFLPPGGELTVVEFDGSRKTYRGEARP